MHQRRVALSSSKDFPRGQLMHECSSRRELRALMTTQYWPIWHLDEGCKASTLHSVLTSVLARSYRAVVSSTLCLGKRMSYIRAALGKCKKQTGDAHDAVF